MSLLNYEHLYANDLFYQFQMHVYLCFLSRDFLAKKIQTKKAVTKICIEWFTNNRMICCFVDKSIFAIFHIFCVCGTALTYAVIAAGCLLYILLHYMLYC